MTLCDQETGGNILCIRLSALGDVVHCMNALTLLREHRPAAHITWIVEERTAGLIENHPYIDDLVTIPRMDWGQALKDPWRWSEVWPEIAGLTSGLRRRKFDASIDFQSSLKSSWLLTAAGAPIRIGFSAPTAREFNHLFQNRLVTAPSRGIHRIERYLALLSGAGLPTEYAPAFLPCAPPHRQVAEKICSELKRPLVVIHPGASAFAEFKRWLPERYGELALKLIREAGASVLVTFGPGEESLAHRVIAASKHEARLSPRLPHLQQLTGLLNIADLFIGGDTGPMHIASALNTPVVALFGPKDPRGTGPFGGPAEIVSARVPCSPCSRRECPDPVCMGKIGTEQVYRAACRLLNGSANPRSAAGEMQTISKPFYCDFELGNWSGKLHSAFSCPEFYRFLSMIGVQEDSFPEDGQKTRAQCRSHSFAETEIAFKQNGRSRRMHMLFNRSRRKGGKRNHALKRYWRTAVKMYDRGVPCIIPVCWMQQNGSGTNLEVLIFDGSRPAAEGPFSRDPAPSAPGLLPPIASALRQFHKSGFHHKRLAARNIAMPGGTKPAFRSLEKVWTLRLPPFVRELCWGRELRPFYRELKEHFHPRDFSRYFLKPYCKNHLEVNWRRRVLARTIHPELDRPFPGK